LGGEDLLDGLDGPADVLRGRGRELSLGGENLPDRLDGFCDVLGERGDLDQRAHSRVHRLDMTSQHASEGERVCGLGHRVRVRKLKAVTVKSMTAGSDGHPGKERAAITAARVTSFNYA
jgi:hypothetical protein